MKWCAEALFMIWLVFHIHKMPNIEKKKNVKKCAIYARLTRNIWAIYWNENNCGIFNPCETWESSRFIRNEETRAKTLVIIKINKQHFGHRNIFFPTCVQCTLHSMVCTLSKIPTPFQYYFQHLGNNHRQKLISL